MTDEQLTKVHPRQPERRAVARSSAWALNELAFPHGEEM
jgi:hypothetical protein